MNANRFAMRKKRPKDDVSHDGLRPTTQSSFGLFAFNPGDTLPHYGRNKAFLDCGVASNAVSPDPQGRPEGVGYKGCVVSHIEKRLF